MGEAGRVVSSISSQSWTFQLRWKMAAEGHMTLQQAVMFSEEVDDGTNVVYNPRTWFEWRDVPVVDESAPDKET
jgi:hypothetical protein